MLQLIPSAIIYVATISVDFRKGIDGLVGVCKKNLAIDPFSGAFFLFYNRSKTTFKILFYDGQGFNLYIKRLSQGRFQYQPEPNETLTYQTICHKALQVLINNGDLKNVNFSQNWRPLKPLP